jgi:hypothetical protein
MARGWNKVPRVLAAAAVMLAIGLPGGPFGPHMAQAAGEESRLSIQSDLALDAATVASESAQSDFIVRGSADKHKDQGASKGGGGADNAGGGNNCNGDNSKAANNNAGNNNGNGNAGNNDAGNNNGNGNAGNGNADNSNGNNGNGNGNGNGNSNGKGPGRDFWEGRYRDINAFERHLARNGTLILKFFLNVSKKEQRRRFLSRLEEPDKNWKFSFGDLEERKHWSEYQDAFEQMVQHTSTKWAPWWIIPADHKWVTRALVALIVTRSIDKLGIKFPEISVNDRRRLAAARRSLLAGG